MSGTDDRKCGCKGIRTCLLCETSNTPRDNVQDAIRTNKTLWCEWHPVKLNGARLRVQTTYKYCPHCDLCWPDDEDKNSGPLYLGKPRLILDFITEEEETVAVSAIDGIQWVPSQSGRRKQDFGPKVNFKKKKVKVGTFTGFPKLTENILMKFRNVPELSDFQAVELCHLEYSPERGSCIDPHVDDCWLWGERLVTINLGSSTVFTLIPFSGDACECREQSQKCFPEFLASSGKNTCVCDHFRNVHLFEDPSNSLFVSSNLTSINKNTAGNDIVDSKLNGDISTELLPACSESKLVTNIYTSPHVINPSGENKFQLPTEEIQPKSDICNAVCEFPSEKDSLITLNDDGKKNGNHCHTNNNSTEQHLKSSTYANGTRCNIDTGKSIDMCSVFRRGLSQPEVVVRIVLPPRSLLILAGCARYNWYHEIKRQDVVSRRLAMTFRELTPQFLEGGKESDLGKELLSIASNLCDFS